MNKSFKVKFLTFLLLILIGFVLGGVVMNSWQTHQKVKQKAKKLTSPSFSLPSPKEEKVKVVTEGNAIADAVATARPAVVNIDTISLEKNPFGDFSGSDPFFRKFFGEESPFKELPRQFEQKGKGSGFIISKDGHVLTNEHVICKANEIKVTLSDGRIFKGKVIGRDKSLDIAVVKIKAGKLPVSKLGDSNQVRLGEWVIAIGNPFGFGQSVTAGVISAKQRTISDLEDRKTLTNLFQTDAAINQGNSGGPLVNLKGEVIGINTAIYSPSGGSVGVGFAIPINLAREILSELIKHGKVVRPWMGITLVKIEPEIAKYFELPDNKGAIISDVAPGSPGDKAGLKRYDVVREVNRKKVKKPEDVVKEVGKHKVKDTLILLILREKQTQIITVTLGERPG